MKALIAIVGIIFVTVAHGQTEQAETVKVLMRFKEPRHESALQGASWSLAHQYGTIEGAESAFKFAGEYFGAFEKYEAGDPAPLAKLGGIKSFKAKLAAMMKDADPGVRCYAITVTGITGDEVMAPQVATFLDRRSRPGDTTCESERAMVALGRLGATGYKLKIATRLKSADSNERAAAIRGLGLLGAKEYAPDVAKILLEPSNTHETAPVQFLIDTGTASSYKRQLVRVMSAGFGGDRARASMYALAAIDAKEHAGDIAALLGDEFAGRDAAKALALLGATEYSEKIAVLLKDSNSLVRCSAAISLGILNAREHTSEIVKVLLNDPEEFVRPYAAAAIVLLRAEAHYKDALPHLENRNSLSEYLIGSQFPSVVEAKVRALKQRALADLDAAAARK